MRRKADRSGGRAGGGVAFQACLAAASTTAITAITAAINPSAARQFAPSASSAVTSNGPRVAPSP